MAQHNSCCPNLKELSWYKCIKLANPNISSSFRQRNIPTYSHIISYCESEHYNNCKLFRLTPLADGIVAIYMGNEITKEVS